jgi:hypothetical protein
VRVAAGIWQQVAKRRAELRRDQGELEATWILGVAFFFGLVSLFNSCTTLHACASCTATLRGLGCSYVGSASIYGDAEYNSSASLGELARGACAPGERQQLDHGWRVCRPLRSYPDALETEVWGFPRLQNASDASYHQQYCGAWIDAKSSVREEPLYYSTYDASVVDHNLQDAIDASFAFPIGYGDLGKFNAACERVHGNVAALRAASRIAFAKMHDTVLRRNRSVEGRLYDLGALAVHGCDTPVGVGVSVHQGGFFAHLQAGTLPSSTRMRLSLAAMNLRTQVPGALRVLELVAGAEPTHGVVDEPHALAVLGGAADFPPAIAEAMAGGKLRTEPTPELAQFISVVATGNVSEVDVDAFLAGLLAVCVLEIDDLIDRPGDREALPRFTALGRRKYAGDGDPLNDDDADKAMVGAPFTWSTLSFFSPGPYQRLCAEFTKAMFPEEIDAIAYRVLVPDGLDAAIETLWSLLKNSVAHVIENDAEVAAVLGDPAGVAAVAKTVELRIPGAPAESSFSQLRANVDLQLSSDDGVVWMAMKSAAAQFQRRALVLLDPDASVCNFDFLYDALTTNAYVLPSFACSHLLLGMLRRPFADADYDGVSLDTRLGFILGHEIGHSTMLTTRYYAASPKLFYGYEASTLDEAIADLVSAKALIHAGLATAEEVCAHVSQVWCGVPTVWRPTTPSHPLVNERGDLLCSKIL